MLKGVRDFTTPGKSGCELTWEYFFPEREMPRAVKLIGDFDTWRWEFKDETAEFCEGLRAEDLSHTSALWKRLLWVPTKNPAASVSDNTMEQISTGIAGIRENGRIVMKYRDNFCIDYCDTYGFETEFEGHKCFAVNLYKFGSLAFGTLIQVYDICISFAFDGSKYTVGLYTAKEDLDVSAIAKKYGGGGHRQAAGFVTKKLPFEVSPE
jgi:oligoribonuclease NrnB/cAMP/cGMP phosphodiesterase (DHH superfamily)